MRSGEFRLGSQGGALLGEALRVEVRSGSHGLGMSSSGTSRQDKERLVKALSGLAG